MLTYRKFDISRDFPHLCDKCTTETILEQTKEANDIKCLHEILLLDSVSSILV